MSSNRQKFHKCQCDDGLCALPATQQITFALRDGSDLFMWMCDDCIEENCPQKVYGAMEWNICSAATAENGVTAHRQIVVVA
jgi:hypothetical protein